jgi:hypothetical protein
LIAGTVKARCLLLPNIAGRAALLNTGRPVLMIRNLLWKLARQ